MLISQADIEMMITNGDEVVRIMLRVFFFGGLAGFFGLAFISLLGYAIHFTNQPMYAVAALISLILCWWISFMDWSEKTA